MFVKNINIISGPSCVTEIQTSSDPGPWRKKADRPHLMGHTAMAYKLGDSHSQGEGGGGWGHIICCLNNYMYDLRTWTTTQPTSFFALDLLGKAACVDVDGIYDC